MILLLRVLCCFHALLGLLEEARSCGGLLTAEAVELVEKPIFAVIVESLFLVVPLFLFPVLFLFLLSLFFLLSILCGPLCPMLILFLLFLFLIDLYLAL